MTTDLNKLADALTRDTVDKVLQEKIEREKEQIVRTVREGGEYVLDAKLGIVITSA